MAAAEVRELVEVATRCQHQRGAQGVWARRFLRLAHTFVPKEVLRGPA
jgi:hypothetical protein